jgi:hypothetical protein
MQLPTETHRRACAKALTLIPTAWAALRVAVIPTLPPDIMAEVLGSLQCAGLVETRRTKDGVQIRRV